MFDQMREERRRIVNSIVQLVYFMRGAIQYNDMFDMTLVERQAVDEFIQGRLEVESKKVHQNY